MTAATRARTRRTPWDALCARALDRDPAGRFSSAREMSEALRAASGDPGEDEIARFLATLPDPLPPEPASVAATVTRPLRPST